MKVDPTVEELKREARFLGHDVRKRIASRYLEGDDRPWIIGFSGGKDSTLVCQLVWEALLSVPPKRRLRPVYILSSDTLVETPYIVELVKANMASMRSSANSLGLPITVRLVLPQLNDTYWVRVVGYGYPPPSKFMRWCTDRLKIRPANRFILEKVSEHGQVVLLLGTRDGESQQRSRSLQRHEIEGGLQAHSTLRNAFVWSPIRDFSTEQVWAYLVFNESPWGGDNKGLRDLYKSASAGECPLVVDETTDPCGNSRFGCYTCTVVERDKSLEGFVLGGKEEFRDLLELRNWLVELRDNPEFRETSRRNGQPGVGPLRMDVRRQILARLLDIQSRLASEVISPAEITAIRQAWLSETLEEVKAETVM